MKPCNSLALSSDSFCQSDTFCFERSLYAQGYASVAGLDEAGRGPLAGPVIASCVVLPRDCDYTLFIDSKRLTAHRREVLFEKLQQNGARIGIGAADAREIEQINILQASLLAMKRAVEDCAADDGGRLPGYLLVDGKFHVPGFMSQLALIKGESKSASIAAASIIAKVTRDRFMMEAHRLYPEYGFNRHQGYPTLQHRQAIARNGPCPLHRRTFKGVMEFVDPHGLAAMTTQESLW